MNIVHVRSTCSMLYYAVAYYVNVYYHTYIYDTYITARIASCIEHALPYAIVTGVETVAELEGNLTKVSPPINVTLSIPSSEGSDRPVTLEDGGCFVGGAGECSPGSDSILLCTLDLV